MTPPTKAELERLHVPPASLRLERLHRAHLQIHLGDPRRTAPARLKTVFRQPVRRA